jgi:endoglucanase
MKIRPRRDVAYAALLLLIGSGDAVHRAAAATSSPQPAAGTADRIPLDHHILIDQFGYLPGEAKVAVLRDPQVGYDKNDHFSPGKEYEVRRVEDGQSVRSVAPVAWKHGAVDALSGDRGWWVDFSALTTPGRYFVYDIARGVRSPFFRIDAHVYDDVLRAATRVYYYQRSGLKKTAAYAGECWVDAAAYVGRRQDTEAHDVTDRDNPAKVRDVSGGWFDAGDTNKYVTFAAQAVHQLLTAYSAHGAAFTDRTGIPESGNGVPDVLDEVRWETDWLKKMQYPDGSFALKVGEVDYVAASPPSADRSPRFYVPGCTSATIAGAGMLAHAAIVFGAFPTLRDEAADLKGRARAAWKQYQGTPDKQTACDSGVVHAGLADLSVEDQNGMAAEAAAYLFALTSEPAFETYLEAHYKDAHPYHDIGWSRYKPDQGDALLFYASLPGAKASLAHAILGDKRADVQAGNQIYGFEPDDDLYRAFLHQGQYHWGSNNPRANYGNSNLDVTDHALGLKDTSTYRTRALEILHYLHGVNPLGMVYLSNMHGVGATSSANEIYHVWFSANSKWSDARTSACGPPPGYVPGGPNANAARDGVPTRISPPTGQPPQKSYKDWNGGWPEASWAVTEPGIYYQSAYVRLVSAFVE